MSIPALLLHEPVPRDPVGYIAGAGNDQRVALGAVLEPWCPASRWRAR